GSPPACTRAGERRSFGLYLESRHARRRGRARRRRVRASPPQSACAGLSGIPRPLSSFTRRPTRRAAAYWVLSPQRVEERRLEMLEQRLGLFRRLVAAKALEQDAVQRRHDDAGVEARGDARTEDALLPAAVDDVSEEVVVDAAQLVHVPD